MNNDFANLNYRDLLEAARHLHKSMGLTSHYYENIPREPPMDEFATKIMQERIKTCKGSLPPDEYSKYCKEILRTYTDYAIKGSTLCQLLYKKRPKSFTSNHRILAFEKHVRKKPQWTTLNEN